jgi:uncharacterized radical SAM protein YgiQ
MSRTEMDARGWAELDVLIITGDAYVDHPSFGAAMIGRVLEAEGCRVGIIAQPDWKTLESITVMGAPQLFVGVTAGNLDSMLSNYTAARHKRKDDVYSAGGVPGKRPNHAAVVYSQMCRRAFPGVPVVLGGMEASMRRVAHYDYWEDKLKPSILADAKADVLVYGMGEMAVREIVRRLRAGRRDFNGLRGTALFLGAKATAAADLSDCLMLPSWDEMQADKKHLLRLTKVVEAQQTPYSGKRLVQMHGNRAVLQEPPAFPVDGPDLDALYELPFQRLAHPSYTEPVPWFRYDQGFHHCLPRVCRRLHLLRTGFPSGQVSLQPQCGLSAQGNPQIDRVRHLSRHCVGPRRTYRQSLCRQERHVEACKSCHRP